MEVNHIFYGDTYEVLKTIPDSSVHLIFTSPPYYGQRDYGFKEQIGLEEKPHQYIDKLIQVFNECKRILVDDGNLFINIGDTYVSSGGVSKKKTQSTGSQFNIFGTQSPQRVRKNWEEWMCEKQLMLIPSRMAIAMQDNHWILRNDIIWAKGVHLNEESSTLGNPLPNAVKDRLNNTYEHIFHFVKNKKYFYELDKLKIPTNDGTLLKNAGDVIYQKVKPNRNVKHIASYPEELIRPFIDACTPKNGIVLDPFSGSGTTLKVAKDLGFNYIGIEGNMSYIKISQERLS